MRSQKRSCRFLRHPADRGPIAQSVEHRPFKPMVEGSNPSGLTTPTPSSRGLGHRPFTPATRVQIPLGSQLKVDLKAARAASLGTGPSFSVAIGRPGSGPSRAAPWIRQTRRRPTSTGRNRSPPGNIARNTWRRSSPRPASAPARSSSFARADASTLDISSVTCAEVRRAASIDRTRLELIDRRRDRSRRRAAKRVRPRLSRWSTGWRGTRSVCPVRRRRARGEAKAAPPRAAAGRSGENRARFSAAISRARRTNELRRAYFCSQRSFPAAIRRQQARPRTPAAWAACSTRSAPVGARHRAGRRGTVGGWRAACPTRSAR